MDLSLPDGIYQFLWPLEYSLDLNLLYTSEYKNSFTDSSLIINKTNGTVIDAVRFEIESSKIVFLKSSDYKRELNYIFI